MITQTSVRVRQRSLDIFLGNAGHGGIRGVVFLANTLVLVPLLLTKLGKDNFAILALVAPFLRYGFNGVFDFGVSSGLVRYVGRSYASNRPEELNGYTSSGLLLYLLCDAILVILYFGFRPFLLPRLMSSDPSLYHVADIFLFRSLLVYCLFTLSSPLFSLLIGIQEVKATHWVGTFSLLVEMVGVLSLVPFGITLQRLLWVYAVNSVSSLLLSIFLAKHYFSDLAVKWQLISWTRTKEVIVYGAQFSATSLASVLGPVVDKLILARYVDLSAVALYEGASRLIDLLKRATQLFLLPLFPMAAAWHDTHTAEQKHALYKRFVFVNLIVSSAIYLIPASLAGGIFRVWLGSGSGLSAKAFIALSFAAFSVAVVSPLTMIFAGIGRIKPLMATALAGLLINLIVSPLLTRAWGFDGLLLGCILAYALVAWLFLLWASREPEFETDGGGLLRLCLYYGVAGMIPGLAISAFLRIHGLQPGRAGELVILAAASICFFGFVLLHKQNRKIFFGVIEYLRIGNGVGLGRRKIFSA